MHWWSFRKQPVSSQVFLGGVISYHNTIKEKLLHVPSEILTTHGAVSGACASHMALGTRENTGATIGVAITGIAGPDGGSKEKPVGTFWIGYSDANKTFATKHFFSSDRNSIRTFAAFCALDIVRRQLLKIPLWDYQAQESMRDDHLVRLTLGTK